MIYFVNKNCVGCGMCCGICPNVFFMNDEGHAEAADKEVNDAVLEDAENAMISCLVSAIELR